MSRLVLPALVGLCCLAPVWAGEEPASDGARSAREAALRVAEAIAADDAATLKRLAEADSPDPWLVADALDAIGRREDARRFAAAAPRPDVQRLPAYLLVVPPSAELGPQRRRLQRAQDAVADPRAVIKVLEGAEESPTVASTRMQFLLGRALHDAGRLEEAARAFARSASLATRIGWLARAAEAHYHCGLAWYDAPDLEGALLAFEKRLEVERDLGSKMGMGRSHYGLYLVHDQLGNGEAAGRHLQEASALLRVSNDAEYLAKLTSSEGAELVHAGDPDGAMRAFEHAIQQIDALEIPDVPARFLPDSQRIRDIRLSLCLNAASTATSLMRHDEARRYASRAHEVAKEMGRPREIGSVRAFLAVVRGAAHEANDEFYEALAEYSRGRDLYKKWQFPTEHADCLHRMGGIRASLGDLTKALDEHEQAIAILTRLGAAWGLARAHRSAAYVYIQLVRTDEAQHHAEAALRLARGLASPELEAQALRCRARLAYRSARFAEALSIIDEALAVAASSSASGTVGELRRLQAEIYSYLGQQQRALDSVEAAIQDVQGVQQAGLLRAFEQLRSRILSRTGRHEEALALARRLLREEQERGNVAGMAWSWMRVADLEWGRTRYADAAAAREKAAGMFIAMGDERRALEAGIQGAREVFWGGDRQVGREKLEHAHSLAKADGSPWLLAWSALGLAEAALAESRHGEAVQWAREAVAQLAAYGMGLSDTESAIARATFGGVYDIGVEAAWRAEDPSAVYEFVERGRASGLLAALGGSDAIREASIPERLRRAEEEARAAVAASSESLNAARRAGVRSTVRARRAELEAAEARLAGAVSSIQREVRLQADLAYQGGASIDEVQKALEGDEALVLYRRVASTHLLAVVVTASKADVVLLGERERVLAALARFAPGTDAEVQPAAVKEARELLIGGLGLSDGVRRLLISPGPDLAYVPFSLLEPGREIACVPSATVYGVIRTQVTDPGTQVLALGDPAYEGTSDASASRLRGGRYALAQLPGTRAEAEAVGDVVLLGKEASETGFLKVVARQRRWKAVHFACHGFVDPEQPTRCALELTADAENDGSLWALEVFRTRVPADLVVLSACESGKGRYIRGEGIMGLVRTFIQAGAPRVIASLWRVDDEATRVLMTKFYELWNPRANPPGAKPPEGAEGREPLGAAAALRAAQAHVRTHPDHPEWSHPRFWAAWVLWGRPD